MSPPGRRRRRLDHADLGQGRAGKPADQANSLRSSVLAGVQLSYANEELIQAIEMLRLMPRDRKWMIPIKIDDCAIPEMPIGIGESLSDLNYISMNEEGYQKSMRRLLSAVGVYEPKIGFGDPIAAGFGSMLELVSGRVIYDKLDVPGFGLDGITFHVTGGWCARRPDGSIASQIIVSAPSEPLERANVLLGLNQFFAVTKEKSISMSDTAPTLFSYVREYSIPKGTNLPAMFGLPAQSLVYDLPFRSAYEARGHIRNDLLIGDWQGDLRTNIFGSSVVFPLEGRFEIRVR